MSKKLEERKWHIKQRLKDVQDEAIIAQIENLLKESNPYKWWEKPSNKKSGKSENPGNGFLDCGMMVP